MKIYTKTGDLGTTSLVGGTRVSKDNIRLDAYGSVDELSAFIAMLCDSEGIQQKEKKVLEKIQERLMIVESRLAIEENRDIGKHIPELTKDDVIFLENEVDVMNSELKPMNSLIIPGGNILASKSHVCRTVCRRAERAIVRLNKQHKVEPVIMCFLNRLSDFFFVLARLLMKQTNSTEKLWKP